MARSARVWRMPAVQAALAAILVTAAAAEPALFESRQLSPAREYTFNIEGPAVDSSGALYVVNFQQAGHDRKARFRARRTRSCSPSCPRAASAMRSGSAATGGCMSPTGRCTTCSCSSAGQKEPRVYFHSDRFNQPNDLTIAPDGTLYASDPHWKRRDGQIWRIVRGPDGNGVGEVMTSERKMTTTNGIDLSPDGKTLYVGESETREIWAYRVDGTKLVAPRLLRTFNDFSIDGLRTDIAGGSSSRGS